MHATSSIDGPAGAVRPPRTVKSRPSHPALFAQPLDVGRTLVSPPPVLRHVLPGLIEGSIGMVAASGGTGKTMFLLQLALALAADRPICGGLFDEPDASVRRDRRPRRVLFVAAEECTRTMALRLLTAIAPHVPVQPTLQDRDELLALRATLEANLLIHAIAGRRPALFNGSGDPTPAYEELAIAAEGAEVIVLDPLRQIHDGEENCAATMNKVIVHLRTLVAGTPAVLIVAHHTSQASTLGGYADHASSARGSTAITDGVRWQLNLSRPREEWLRTRGVAEEQAAWLLRVDLAKHNNCAPLAPQLLRRSQGGLLTFVESCAPGSCGPSTRKCATPRGSRA